MSTKKQLQILFEHVRDEEIERLDDISTMAKRNGRGGDVVEMELDLEAGWPANSWQSSGPARSSASKATALVSPIS